MHRRSVKSLSADRLHGSSGALNGIEAGTGAVLDLPATCRGSRISGAACARPSPLASRRHKRARGDLGERAAVPPPRRWRSTYFQLRLF